MKSHIFITGSLASLLAMFCPAAKAGDAKITLTQQPIVVSPVVQFTPTVQALVPTANGTNGTALVQQPFVVVQPVQPVLTLQAFVPAVNVVSSVPVVVKPVVAVRKKQVAVVKQVRQKSVVRNVIRVAPVSRVRQRLIVR